MAWNSGWKEFSLLGKSYNQCHYTGTNISSKIDAAFQGGSYHHRGNTSNFYLLATTWLRCARIIGGHKLLCRVLYVYCVVWCLKMDIRAQFFPSLGNTRDDLGTTCNVLRTVSLFSMRPYEARRPVGPFSESQSQSWALSVSSKFDWEWAF